MEAAIKTHVGLIREVNEDSAGVFRRKDGPLLAVVADGMGGHQAGEVASRMALDKLDELFMQVNTLLDEKGWQSWLLESIQIANQTIYSYARQNSSHFGMGTTLVAALFLDSCYLIAHVGDSRAYRLINGQLQKLTDDHSLVNELVRVGQLAPEEAAFHPQRNVITRALGTEEEVLVDLDRLAYVGGEQFMLCSDGLSSMVPEHEMEKILSGTEELDIKATRLLQAALDAGGDDNITLILIGEQVEASSVK
jgi:protein phosphatase